MAFVAYLVTCLVSEKKYVGITSTSIKRRWSGHVSQSRHANTKFSRAIRKYGRQNFRIEVIASSRTFKDLLELERILISQYESKEYGYNATDGGEGVLGFIHSPELKKKMSEIRLRVYKESDLASRLSVIHKEIWANASDEFRKRQSDQAKRNVANTLSKTWNRPKKEKPVLGKGFNMFSRASCKQGHAYSEENTRINKKGHRVCLTCKRAKNNVARDLKRKIARLEKSK